MTCSQIYKLKDKATWRLMMQVYLKLKFKMKLSYECHRHDIELEKLISRSISLSQEEKYNLARANL